MPELSTTGGTSDARFIKNYCPVAEFGLVGQTMHKVDERCRIDDITALTDIYAATLSVILNDRSQLFCAVPSLNEILSGIYAAIALRDPQAVTWLDDSVPGAWKSFVAAILHHTLNIFLATRQQLRIFRLFPSIFPRLYWLSRSAMHLDG